MRKVNPLVWLALGFIALSSISGQAQTYVYTYIGNDFTSVSNAANELEGGLVPYTTSDKITGSIAFSAPLGDNYEGNPSTTMLSYNFTDDVGPQNIVGSTMGGGLGFPYVMDSTFGTDSSGNIVSWNFSVVAFLSFFSPPETKGIQTENDSVNVADFGNIDTPFGYLGDGSVSSDPGVWVETVVPEPSIPALLAVGASALVMRWRRKA